MNRRTSAWAAAHAQAGARLGGKALSLLLSLVLCLTLLPAAASAAERTHEHYLCGDSCGGESHPQELGKTTFAKRIYQQNNKLYIDGKEWEKENDYSGYTHLYLKSGAYYLDSDIEMADAIEPFGNVTLCLNGKTLTAPGSAIYITPNGSLTLTDCTDNGKITGKSSDSAGVNMSFSTFNMYGGTITGCRIGVSITGTFNMYGGKITGNGGNDKNASGVYLGTQGTMTVSGAAKITGNTRNGSACNVYVSGGKTITVGGKLTGGAGNIGVTAAAAPTAHTPVAIAAGAGGYTLTDTDRSAFALDSSAGGYTLERDGNSIMLAVPHTHSWTYALDTTNTENDTITATCKGMSGDVDFDGGSVTISAPTDLTYDGAAKEAVLTNTISGLTDPVISYQIKNGDAWGALPTGTAAPVEAGTYKAGITVGGETASVEYTIERHDHCICGKDGSVTVAGHTHTSNLVWHSWDSDNGLPDQTGYYYLTKDVTLAKTWTPADETVLCLNGKTVTANFDGSAITVQAPFDFTLTDCADTPGMVTHGMKAANNPYNGRGVEVKDQGNAGVGGGFNLYGGSISGNTLTRDGYTQGGGVYAGYGSIFRMYGGSITGNRLVCTLNNANSALDSAEGGGVYARSNFDLYGGSITGNGVEANHTAQGGGVYVAGRFNISGAPVITGNTAVKNGQSRNNNYYGSNIAYIIGKLTAGAAIGVTQDPSASAFAQGRDMGTTYTITDEDAAKFSSDESGYIVMQDGNRLTLSKPVYTVTFHGNGGTLTGDSIRQTGRHGKLITLPIDPTRSGYTFDGWYTATTGGDRVDADTVYNANTDLYAHWTRTGSSSGGSSGSSTYPVTAPKADNGTVTVSPSRAAKGDTVTVTVTPDKGYVLETLTALDKDGKELTLTKKSDGQYTFTMPAGKVEVKATFMDDNTMLNYFVDVKAGDFFYDAVLWTAQKGITNGINNTEFGPSLSCTRAQIVTFLWRVAGSPEPKSASSFADIPADSYYAKAVAWAVENGITGGTGDGRFDPDATCTREQAVTFLYRASGSPAVSGGSAFGDVAENAYYADAVAWAEKNGVTGGIGGGLFGSGNDCTRAQIVTLLYRAYSE